MVSVILYPCILFIDLSIDLFVLCVKYLVNNSHILKGLFVILLLNVMLWKY